MITGIALHSILVKSIPGGIGYDDVSRMSLHSILVKSIQKKTLKKVLTLIQLYIPFWLNLYSWGCQFARNIIDLYIPFWLNLYNLNQATQTRQLTFTFHSG